MAIKILMPSLSPTMLEGKISKWVKKEGDKIKSGDIIAEIETDKAMIDFESTEEGILGKIVVADGTEGVKVNELIAVMLEEGEDKAAIDAILSSSAPASSSTEAGTPEVKNADNANAEGNNKPESKASSDTTKAASNTTAATKDHGLEQPVATNEIEQAYLTAPKRSITVREGLREAMSEEMRRDKDVFLMGEEVADYQGAYKVSQGMLEEFGPGRVIDTPITEYGFTGLASGAAFTGLKPIVEYMNFNFALQSVDHILNSSGKTLYMSGGEVNSPIVFRGLNGSGTRVGAQHSQCVASWFAHIPGLIVIAIYSAEDAKGLLKSAIRDPNPVIFLEHEIMYGKSFEVPDVEDLIIPIGKAKIEKAGHDVTIVSYAYGTHVAMESVAELEKLGISAEIINLRTLRPLDIDTIINSVKKTNRIISVEEGWPYAGIGSEIAALVMEHCFDDLDAPVIRVTGKDVPMPYAANLEKAALPTVADVIEAVKKVTNHK